MREPLPEVPFSEMKEIPRGRGRAAAMQELHSGNDDDWALSRFAERFGPSAYRKCGKVNFSAKDWLDARKAATQCAICGKVCENMSQKHGDHDHDTGNFRGVLCGSCNFAVGWMEKFIRQMAWAKKIVDYLRRARVKD